MDVLHRDSRTIFITGEITDGMGEVRQAINDLGWEDSQSKITLVINSVGGSVTGALSVVDAMDHARRASAQFYGGLTIIGQVEGVAESSALTILQGCDHRIAGRSSLLMSHGTTGSIKGDIQEIRAYERYRLFLHEHMARLYARRTHSRNVSDWMRHFESDLEDYYTPPDALELGLIDEIVSS